MLYHPFAVLEPDAVLSCIERATGRYLQNICRPHSSYINRVYELQDEDGTFFVAKFFRPERWSGEALQDELRFVLDCAEQELPVIAPLPLADGSWLGSCEEIHFAVYPRCGGRLVDEYSDEQWLELGRLIGRLHTVGTMREASHRNKLHPQHTTREQVEYILVNNLVPDDLKRSFSQLCDEIIAEITEDFDTVRYARIHGDCHSGNLIYRPGESFFIIDFDDMVVGPAVQDFWMLLPGTHEDSQHELSLFLDGYETFCPFDYHTLKLIEPLRAMRYIHYISWCGRQYLEDGDTRINETFASYSYWQQELGDLEDQLAVIRKNS
jgi:Ser/Thr protein kinase RdoA (MazF antagonist)